MNGGLATGVAAGFVPGGGSEPAGQRGPRGQRGVALLNALILAAAIAGVAAVLIVAAGRGLDRSHLRQARAQALLHLDAAAYQLAHELGIDRLESLTDSLNETWASGPRLFSYGDAEVTAHVTDLQGRFNLNWLSFEDDAVTFSVWERLSASAGLHISQSVEIAAFLVPRSLPGAARYVARPIPMRPEGGTITHVSQLRLVEQIRARGEAALAPLVAALPANTQLNVNTVGPGVLAAYLPGADDALVAAFLRDRDARPFADVDSFLTRLRRRFGEKADALLPEARLSVGSDWFQARLSVSVQGYQMRQVVILHRPPLGGRARIAYRLPDTG